MTSRHTLFKKGTKVSSVFYLPMDARKIRPSQITYTNLGLSRGNKRLWLEGLRLAECGFTPGKALAFVGIPELCAATLEITNKPTNHSVSGRKKSGVDEYTPIIDINNQDLSNIFQGIQTVRVLYYKDRMLLQAHSNELNSRTAIEDLEINSKARKISMGVIGVGGGIFSSAMKEGLQDTGIDIETSWVIDIEKKYLESAIKNSSAISSNTIIVHGDAEKVESNFLVPINMLLISNDCGAHSSAGKAKNKLLHAESHDTGGLMILRTIDIIQRFMPPIIWHENVVEFNSSASAELFAGKLRALGYVVHQKNYGSEMGTLEHRVRSIVLAHHKDLPMDLVNQLVPVMEKEQMLKDVMDDVPLDDPCWRPYTHLLEKAERDKAAGKGFQLQHYSGEEPNIAVMRRGIRKAGSTDPYFKHPENPNLFRLPTVGEQARMMKIPEQLVANLSATTASEILGQSGSYALVKAIGVMTGKVLNTKYNGMEYENLGEVLTGSPLAENYVACERDESNIDSTGHSLSLF